MIDDSHYYSKAAKKLTLRSVAAQGQMMTRCNHLDGGSWPSSTTLGAPCKSATAKTSSSVLASGSLNVSLRSMEYLSAILLLGPCCLPAKQTSPCIFLLLVTSWSGSRLLQGRGNGVLREEKLLGERACTDLPWGSSQRAQPLQDLKQCRALPVSDQSSTGWQQNADSPACS